MRYRAAIAMASLVSGLVAVYLHLWKLGLVGTLACTSGHGCEYVQGSRYGWFLGVDVALIGAVGYALLFVTALVGTTERFQDDPRLTAMLAGLIVPAALFTVRLKYAEFVILRSFCPWCLVSAVTIALCLVLLWLDLRRLRAEREAWAGEAAG